ncbi:PREDICTED: complex III assembly factor LYRM7 [Dufourea novaeangliae]|uniref:complex III assembly factor LYRM7 n=1 Tax=Dufourea novaeangliae TaxID=178035 RepID=UPI0007674F59|nr:PREDICTED: complex III assembly factor LYRM7 [Dufourea novaeangliae]
MGDNLRRQVLNTFKKLHRTRMNTFKGDEHALTVVRNKINEEYKKYKQVTNSTTIEEVTRHILTMANLEKRIKMVKNYPVLYDLSHED